MVVSHRAVAPSLSERRGKSELQYPSSRHSPRPSTSTQSFQPSSSISSFSSHRSYPTASTSNTSDVMSIPATPTESQWYTMDSARLDEDCECCGPLCEDRTEEYRGLGLGMDHMIGRVAAMELSEKLHAAGTMKGSQEGQISVESSPQYQHNYHFAMPPTPPSHVGERVYCSTSDSALLDGFEVDEGVFGSFNPLVKPDSPPAQQQASRGRRTSLLNKVFPQKFRDNIMRRMSGANSIPSISRSQVNLPPLRIPPYTPPTEATDFFWPMNTATSGLSSQPNPDFEFELPIPEKHFSRQALYSPLQSPRTMPTLAGTDVFPELAKQPLPNEVVHSPLYPPTVSPLMSPCVPTTSQTSLNMLPPIRPEDYKVPSIDPTSPKPGRKLSEPIDTISPSTIDQMVLGMQKDEEAYTYMIDRMKGHGWSTPEEIQNLELQREESNQKWQLKINGAKRVLAGLNKCGYPAYQFPDRSTRSMDSVRSDYTTVMGRSCIDAGPGAKFHRTYSR